MALHQASPEVKKDIDDLKQKIEVIISDCLSKNSKTRESLSKLMDSLSKEFPEGSEN